MAEQTQSNFQTNLFPWKKIGLLVIFLVVIVSGSVLTFSRVRDFVSTWNMTSLPGIPLINEKPTPTLTEDQESVLPILTPTPQPIPVGGPQPEPWDGASRVTVLVMGLDFRDWELGEGPPRTDTMILLTLDPLSESAGMLSIPRDLWVSIPGFNYGKINTAYQLGEAYNLPGGGPGLAMKTVEGLIGVPIQYYALIEFSAFVRFIDEIGGVKVNIPDRIKIDIIGDEVGEIWLKPGVQTLSGDYALAYARARKTSGGDFDRAQRQQQVILSVRDRILSYDLVPILIQKGPVLYDEIASGVITNLGLDQAFQLAWLAQQIEFGNIQRGVINEHHITFGKSPDGLDILRPLPDQIRLMRDRIFTPSGPISPVAEQNKKMVTLMVEEAATLSILNGTFTPGLAGRTQEFLERRGAIIVVVADAENKPHPYTSIYDYTGNPYTLRYLVGVMGISEYRIHHRYAPDSEVDVAIILGDDWAATDKMP
jgi:LCP family protein required for cell wall assembly